jgi:outer membrane protein assembly factor BamB
MNRFLPLLALCCLAAVQDKPKVEQVGTPRRFLAADYSKGVLAIFGKDGKVEWQTKIRDIHDAWVLPSGNILYQQGWTRIVEITPDKKEVWSYDAAKMNGNEGKRVEVHAFQRLADGLTMIVESGPGRILEVDKDGAIKKEVKLPIDKPDPHRDTRNVRKLDNGHYLVCHEALGRVREYDGDAKIVWEREVKGAVYGAVRLKNGNTLISAGNGHRVFEVDMAGKEVWAIERNDLPGIELAWMTQVARLANGNTVIVNCHGRPSDPQIIEVSPEKKVVWSYRDFETLGGATPVAEVLDDPASTIR